jgi:hypothetical protein
MLLCADDSFYVGITSDIEQRIGQHEFGWDETCYTFKRLEPREEAGVDSRRLVRGASDGETSFETLAPPFEARRSRGSHLRVTLFL